MQQLNDSIALLSRTPATLNAQLRNLPDTWLRANEGENTWDAFEILGHLIYGEQANWMPRARMILQTGDTLPFAAFDRRGHINAMQNKTIAQLLDEFVQLRSQNLAELLAWNLQPEDFNRRGQHPALGTVTLSQLIAAWTVHDLTHLHQLSRVLAHQYREAVGPWNKFLGVLQCSGHSEPR